VFHPVGGSRGEPGRPDADEHHPVRHRPGHRAGRGQPPDRPHRADVRQHVKNPPRRLGNTLTGRFTVDLTAAELVPDRRRGFVDHEPVDHRGVQVHLVEQGLELVALVVGDRDPAGDQAADQELQRTVRLGGREQFAGVGQRVVVDSAGEVEQQIVHPNR
jgi:hypothetical protein